MTQSDYLKRIGYNGSLEPTLPVLAQLQKAHLLHIPFENLDIHYGHVIALDLDKIFNKVVLNHRGGFCYELNGLFCELLTSLGFVTKRVSARVYTPEKGYGYEFDHLVTLVKLGGFEYLTDVGFGDFAYAPIKIELDVEQCDMTNKYKVKSYDDGYLQINRLDGTDMVPEYIFKNQRREYQEFANMCTYHQTNPDSHFTRNKLISLATIDGRKTLTDKKFKVTRGSTVIETPIKTEAEFERYLWSEFAIKMSKSTN